MAANAHSITKKGSHNSKPKRSGNQYSREADAPLPKEYNKSLNAIKLRQNQRRAVVGSRQRGQLAEATIDCEVLLRRLQQVESELSEERGLSKGFAP